MVSYHNTKVTNVMPKRLVKHIFGYICRRSIDHEGSHLTRFKPRMDLKFEQTVGSCGGIVKSGS